MGDKPTNQSANQPTISNSQDWFYKTHQPRGLESFMNYYHSEMLRNILYYHNMQYQADPTMKTPENGQNPHFWL